MKPRIAVLGCGYWGSNHIRTLKALGALHAVSDVNPARAEGFASEQDCLAIEPEALFARKDIDAIVMALPPQFHADMAVRAVQGGKDVLVEKPIALTVTDAERSVQAAADNGRVFMVGHVLRFHPAFETLKALIDNGELGEVRYIHSHRLGLGKFHTENDALWDLAPHDLSMILAITGTEPIEVRGEGAALLDNLSDFAHLHMRFPNGLRSHLFASRLNPYRERRLTVVGTKAMAVFDDVEPWERKLAVYRHAVWQDSGQWAFTTNEPSYVAVGEGMPLTRELEHFIQCIETRAEPRTGGEEAIRVLRILTAGTITHTGSSSREKSAAVLEPDPSR
ncbi:Gfo/Idh/MocA family oxidoreductase [Mesorhizobium mediterraneum]|uniref:Oxidoreductase n=1 Tax=Mesorhizobium mediterraneum TaxID=43617 RepID=A0AB36RCR8_9HYPH|nr:MULTISPECIES: Gfo/Idh/MocA family oxidoreductase [Mesorhizobium]PAQ02692.1 oxidoreductase [Mesorhizobium mediterraneum]RUV04329.1 Gfo/Idh/MocA family oxidoreductase [Mesorhizobium sp. M6A.T.Cr.TU.017.01.1.1]RWN40723.1 MAG: Gfo/Idh/MocA family oxidoreductase [Mesorhizobium sp.]RWO98896.1 MAG: Gfo/Idh/MocA family oxidoreductase [Mesorhizobium sp.]TIM44446.1 MAG: Gfo/Idh/MocA family oxidoreductase [Mesorhizobium sp.]